MHTKTLLIVFVLMLIVFAASFAAGAAWGTPPAQAMYGQAADIPTDAPGELGRAARHWLRWQQAWDRVTDRFAALEFAAHPGQKLSWSCGYRMPEFAVATAEVYWQIAFELKGLVKQYRERCDRMLYSMEHPKGKRPACWLPLLRYAGWPAKQLRTCLRVIWRESNGIAHPAEDNRPGDNYVGLFQLDRDFGRHVKDIFRPLTNVRLALQLWHRRGWQPWAATAY